LKEMIPSYGKQTFFFVLSGIESKGRSLASEEMYV